MSSPVRLGLESIQACFAEPKQCQRPTPVLLPQTLEGILAVGGFVVFGGANCRELLAAEAVLHDNGVAVLDETYRPVDVEEALGAAREING